MATSISALPDGPVSAARRPFVTGIQCDGWRVGLQTVFVEGSSKIMQSLGGAWSTKHRMWVYANHRFRQQVLTQLVSRLRGPAYLSYSVDDLHERAQAAWRQRDPLVFVPYLDCQLIPLQAGGYLCQFAFDEATGRAMSQLHGIWQRPAQGWELRGSLTEILEVLASQAGILRDQVFVHDQVIALEDLVAPPETDIGIRVGGDVPIANPLDGLVPNRQGNQYIAAFGTPVSRVNVDEAALAAAVRRHNLYDYQGDGVRHFLSTSSALLADDMGLGKTRQAVVASRLAAGGCRVLIACPASLRINWAREIGQVFPDARIATVGEDDPLKLAAAEWHIATYERLGTVVRDTATAYEVFVLDEAHYLKEHSANRTRNAFLLAQRIPRRFLLTGTPVLNRETELHTLLRLSGHDLGNIPLADFKALYAGDESRRAGLARRISEWMLRRNKDVLKNLAGKSHQVCYVVPSLGLADYRSLLADPAIPPIAKVTKLRQEIERLKIDWLVESLESLPADTKALVFCEYLDTVDSLKQALLERRIGCVSLTGSDSALQRQKSVDRLQSDEAVRVFIGTTAAAGVGLTLTAASYVFFASLPWTPALKNQAEDRAYRNGQTRHVIVKIPLIPDTIDEDIYRLIEHKAELSDSILAGAQKHNERDVEATIAKMFTH